MRRRFRTTGGSPSLLTSHREAGSFLESPGLHVADVAAQLPTLGVTQSGSSSLSPAKSSLTIVCLVRWERAAWASSTRRRTLLSGGWWR